MNGHKCSMIYIIHQNKIISLQSVLSSTDDVNVDTAYPIVF